MPNAPAPPAHSHYALHPPLTLRATRPRPRLPHPLAFDLTPEFVAPSGPLTGRPRVGPPDAAATAALAAKLGDAAARMAASLPIKSRRANADIQAACAA